MCRQEKNRNKREFDRRANGVIFRRWEPDVFAGLSVVQDPDLGGFVSCASAVQTGKSVPSFDASLKGERRHPWRWGRQVSSPALAL